MEPETFGTYQFFNLTNRNFNQVCGPKGFGHGFLTMEDETEVCYKIDEYYEPSAKMKILYDDFDLGIDWPATCFRVSKKDSLSISLAQFRQQLMCVKERLWSFNSCFIGTRELYVYFVTKT